MTEASAKQAGGASDGDSEDDEPPGILYPAIIQASHTAVEQGMAEDDAIELAVNAFIEAIPKVIGGIVASLHKGKPELLERLAKERSFMTGVIEDRWGSALATYEATAYLAYELAASIHSAYTESLDRGEPQDVTAETAFLLHGRACTLANEVLCLMRNGFANGAAARWRTLQEITVVLMLITEHAHLDLAVRYMDHAVIEQWNDLEDYQAHAAALGRQPFASGEVEALREKYEAVLQRRGPHFSKRNQWAEPLFPGSKDIQYRHLEERAGLQYLRPFYRLSNHHIHAGARAAALNLLERRFGRVIGVGARADDDIGEIGHGALISLFQCMAALQAHVPVASENPDHLVGLHAMQRFVADAGRAFGRAAARPD